MPYTVTCRDGDRQLESSDFDTEQEATEYAIVAKRCYDHAPVGSFDGEVSVVVKSGGPGGKREGAGRKAVDPFNPRTVTVTAKVEPALKDWLDRQPEGASECIRNLILRAEIDSRML